jgi:hypothetical protein
MGRNIGGLERRVRSLEQLVAPDSDGDEIDPEIAAVMVEAGEQWCKTNRVKVRDGDEIPPDCAATMLRAGLEEVDRRADL